MRTCMKEMLFRRGSLKITLDLACGRTVCYWRIRPKPLFDCYVAMTCFYSSFCFSLMKWVSVQHKRRTILGWHYCSQFQHRSIQIQRRQQDLGQFEDAATYCSIVELCSILLMAWFSLHYCCSCCSWHYFLRCRGLAQSKS